MHAPWRRSRSRLSTPGLMPAKSESGSLRWKKLRTFARVKLGYGICPR